MDSNTVRLYNYSGATQQLKLDAVIGSLSSGTSTPDWADITNIPADIADGDDNTQLSEAEVETFVTNGAIDLFTGTTLNTENIATETWVTAQDYATNSTLSTWTGSSTISTVGTITSGTWNGTPITSTFIEDGTVALGDLAQNSCTDGQIMKWSDAAPGWVCAEDNNDGGTRGALSTTTDTIYTEKILYEETLTTTQSNFDIQNIDQTYDDLEIIISGRSDYASASYSLLNLLFNNDTVATNYRNAADYGGSISSGAQAGDSPSIGALTAASSYTDSFTPITISIPFYSNSDRIKISDATWGERRTTTETYTQDMITTWENTAAINRITLTLADGSNFIAGTTLRILGKKAIDVVTGVSGGVGGIAIDDPITNGTVGSLLFVGTGNVLSQDNSNIFWDFTNSRLGIGTNTPQHTLDVAGNIGLSQNAYINFGSTDGETGYGFRDNGGQIEIKNQSDSNWNSLVSETNLPDQVEVPVITPKTVSGVWTKGVDTNVFTNSRIFNSSINDYLEWPVLLKKGSWKLTLIGQAGPSRGEITIYIDGVLIGVADFYNSNYVNNIEKEFSSISITETGNKTLRIAVEGKNASSSDYVTPINIIVFTKE